MSQEKKILIQKVVIGGFILVLAVNFIYRKHTQGNLFTSAKPGKDILVTKDMEAEMEKFSGEDISYTGTSARNPFQRPAEIVTLEDEGLFGFNSSENAAKSAGEKLILEGVIWGGKESLAIISGEVVGEGENAVGAKVLSIAKDKVIVMKNGKKIELRAGKAR
ncbi:MAG: hypothetical protein HQ549_02680 [Candidatus Omnitrophica bacterium]|nr:hypothetical protein [Candidatus Omnitrophota bacterium]